MCTHLLCLCSLLLVLTLPSAQAKSIPYYRMDSLAFLSDAVVLCEEQNIVAHSVQHKDWHETLTRVHCRVIQTYKGDLAARAEIEIEYDSFYTRGIIALQNTGYEMSDGLAIKKYQGLVRDEMNALQIPQLLTGTGRYVGRDPNKLNKAKHQQKQTWYPHG